MRRASSRTLFHAAPVLALGLLAACSGTTEPVTTTPPDPQPPRPVVSAPPPPPGRPAPKTPPPAKEAAFKNPGGMWMPRQIAEPSQQKQLKELGLKVDAAELGSPTSPLLQAIVSLGGCSASFVSPDGLIATNHHCAITALQQASSKDDNILEKGFVAKTRAEERSNGPTARVFVTQAMRDVTKEVTTGLDKVAGDRARYKEIEKRQKKLVAECEAAKKGVRCNVSSFFGGAEYQLIEQLEIKDVRIAYAPHEGVGNFGGEIDNWRWPRHSGDFTLFRAYVGKDGLPAAFAKDNVPYASKNHLKVATAPLAPADLVLVAGYPGSTSRLRTAAEVDEAVSWQYPRSIKMFEDYLPVLQQLAKIDKDVAIKANPIERGINNAYTKFKGVLEGLVKGGLAAQRTKQEAELKAWIDADPQRKKTFGDALPTMAKLVAEQQKTRDTDAAQSEPFRLVKLLASASTIVRMAEERPKPDAERDPGYQERNWQRMEQGQVALTKQYDRRIDVALFTLALRRAAQLPEKQRPPILAAVAGASGDRIEEAVAALYATTTLEDEATRVKLFKTATTEELKKSADPLVKLALAMRPIGKKTEERDEAYAGAMSRARPRYTDALRAQLGGQVAPDANGTLRVTYGTVRGYKPAPDAAMYYPFTTLAQAVKKTTGVDPFHTPPALLEAERAGRFGPWIDETLGDVPVNFLSDLDITGGNSGSATLNAKGELVGLAFDHNIESVASDWLFMPEMTRTIHVDARYMLWVMDAVDRADHLLREMGVTPAVP